MIETILPPCVVTAEAFESLRTPHPRAGEGVSSEAADRRRREYDAVRHLATRAMTGLGRPPTAVLTGNNGEPLWPQGLVGSMTHCIGYQAAALAPADRLASLGIDAEPHTATPRGTLAKIAQPPEQRHLALLTARHPAVHWDRLLFSAKESVYKAWFPLTRHPLGFHQATLTFDPTSQTFTAHLCATGSPGGATPLPRMNGRWCVQEDLIVTAVAVPRIGSRPLECTPGDAIPPDGWGISRAGLTHP